MTTTTNNTATHQKKRLPHGQLLKMVGSTRLEGSVKKNEYVLLSGIQATALLLSIVASIS